jgi:hypothetical protein
LEEARAQAQMHHNNSVKSAQQIIALQKAERERDAEIERNSRVAIASLRRHITTLETLRVESMRLMSEVEAHTERPDRVAYFQAKHMEVCRERTKILKACDAIGGGA